MVDTVSTLLVPNPQLPRCLPTCPTLCYPWTAATTRLPCPSSTPRTCSNSSTESVVSSNSLILYSPLLLLPSIFSQHHSLFQLISLHLSLLFIILCSSFSSPVLFSDQLRCLPLPLKLSVPGMLDTKSSKSSGGLNKLESATRNLEASCCWLSISR